MSAAPKLGTPKAAFPTSPEAAGFDPNQLDPAMMMQMSQMLARLPKGQMQRLQGLMQKAMAGKDVSRESAEFEKTLPLEFQEMIRGMSGMPGMGMPGMSMPAIAPSEILPPEGKGESDMSVDDARRIIEEAVAAGKLSRDQADALLNPQSQKS